MLFAAELLVVVAAAGVLIFAVDKNSPSFRKGIILGAPVKNTLYI